MTDAEDQAAVLIHATSDAVDAALFSPDLFLDQLWQWLDRESKRALRSVSVAMRKQLAGAVVVVASPDKGFSAQDPVAWHARPGPQDPRALQPGATHHGDGCWPDEPHDPRA
ncbi:hypothetical protein FOA52_014118 [Chlamydomonas sp. UWO 241]|nr:hypothetical protein FOA52_014118 [Chlamydomonas sp. UWO 241]